MEYKGESVECRCGGRWRRNVGGGSREGERERERSNKKMECMCVCLFVSFCVCVCMYVCVCVCVRGGEKGVGDSGWAKVTPKGQLKTC